MEICRQLEIDDNGTIAELVAEIVDHVKNKNLTEDKKTAYEGKIKELAREITQREAKRSKKNDVEVAPNPGPRTPFNSVSTENDEEEEEEENDDSSGGTLTNVEDSSNFHSAAGDTTIGESECTDELDVSLNLISNLVTTQNVQFLS